MSVNFNKNGIVQSGGFSNISPTQDMEIKVLDDGSVWARIHWLDVSETVEWFADANEVAKCIDKTNRYSRMGIVDEFKTADGVYEFMLTYPSLSDTLYNRWTQTSSPNASTVTGFTAITTTWNVSTYYGGLRYRNTSTCIYACDSGNTWFSPIGQKTAWSVDDGKYIPATNGGSQTSTELWVRVDTLSQQTQMNIFKNFITSKDFMEL